MMRLISWTGWTKEDWKDALKFCAEVLVGLTFLWTMLFLTAYAG